MMTLSHKGEKTTGKNFGNVFVTSTVRKSEE
jgi:hypothetical protein